MKAFFITFENQKSISEKYLKHLQNELTNIENDGLYKRERIITSQQSAEIVANGKSLNFCANNYWDFLIIQK
jgi:glycine C-acetyltransferase